MVLLARPLHRSCAAIEQLQCVHCVDQRIKRLYGKQHREAMARLTRRSRIPTKFRRKWYERCSGMPDIARASIYLPRGAVVT